MELGSGPVTSVAGRGWVVVLVSGDITDATDAATASTIAKRDVSGGLSIVALTASGNVNVGSLSAKEGANRSMGVATLVAGLATVSTNKASATMRVFHSRQTAGASQGHVSIQNIVAGTSFQLFSNSNTDTGIIAWLIIEPGA